AEDLAERGAIAPVRAVDEGALGVEVGASDGHAPNHTETEARRRRLARPEARPGERRPRNRGGANAADPGGNHPPKNDSDARTLRDVQASGSWTKTGRTLAATRRYANRHPTRSGPVEPVLARG